MWYAHQIAHGQPITDPLDPTDFRRQVFKVLAGNCMQRSHFLDDTCKICHISVPFEERVICQQCSQWFHCKCIGVPYAASSSACYKFVCP